ncbi:transporter [Flavipsychrobacter stenotrophus]|uniref:Transporter n=1 Tax=Flavipsychrobacter stenotrophus TaxID=2077091 RepID=A0A2S7T1Y2_9BACT|nr:ion channel [Flavipsychrobacter stenotrophus]PQJ12805.1 transporter [Flavipsychrobacter stenotrophus]
MSSPGHRKINPFSKQNNDTGFASNNTDVGGRFINKDGTYNLEKEGMPFYNRMSLFHDMLYIPVWKFIGIIVVFYLSINLAFTTIYYILCPDQLIGIIPGNKWKIFKELFYFSAQTFTTVGYGRVNPVGDSANIVAMLEALTGFLSLAIATGLIYGRFSRPRGYLKFSDHALVSPYKGITALMFRFVAYKDKHTLTDLDIRVNVVMQLLENDTPTYKYFTLELERNKVESMPMSWTVVHPITETSPFYGFTEDDMKAADVELYINLRAFDEVFSNYVQQRTSYTYDEILFDRKFIPMFRESPDGRKTILELHKLNIHNEVKAKTS